MLILPAGEHEHVPEFPPPSVRTALVLGPKAARHSRVDILGHPGLQHHRFEQPLEAGAQPLAHRDAEAHLAAGENPGGQMRRHGVLDDMLAAAVADFEFGREAAGEVAEAIVQPGTARLQRVGHGGAVDLDQDAGRQIGFDVDRLHLLERGQVGDAREALKVLGKRAVAAQLRFEVL